jgi:hypothetical protein
MKPAGRARCNMARMTKVRQRSLQLEPGLLHWFVAYQHPVSSPVLIARPRPVACPLAGRGDNRDVAPMPTRRHYRRPNPDRRRALELLAVSRHGYGKAILRAHGFSIDMMVELVKAGLATTKRERMAAGGQQTDVVRVRITDAGRQALAKMSK